MRIEDVRNAPAHELIDRFDYLSNPFPLIVALTTAAWFLIALFVRSGSLSTIGIAYPLDQIAMERLTFLFYFALYGSWWAVYLTSATGKHGARSLRSLLDITAMQFMRAGSGQLDEESVIQGIVEKSRATISGLSVLVSASLASLILMLQLYERLISAELTEERAWQVCMLAIAGGVGFLAFTSLLVAADAHDTVHNRFPKPPPSTKAPNTPSLEFRIKSWTYEEASKRRYIGLILLIAQVACSAACFYPIYGALCIAAALTMGYTYWFPSVLRSNLVAAWGSMIGFVLFGPFLLFFFVLLNPIAQIQHGVWFVVASCVLWALTMPMLNTAVARVRLRTRNKESERLYTMAWCSAVAHCIGALMATSIAVLGAGWFSLKRFGEMLFLPSNIAAGALMFAGTFGFCAITSMLKKSRTEAAMFLTRFKVPAVAILAFLVLQDPPDLAHFTVTLAALTATLTGVVAVYRSPKEAPLPKKLLPWLTAVVLVWSLQEVILAQELSGPIFRHLIYEHWTALGYADLAHVHHALLWCGAPSQVAVVLQWSALFGLAIAAILYVAVWMRTEKRPPNPFLRDHDGAPRVGLFLLYGALGIGLGFTLYVQAIHEIGLARANLITCATMAVGIGIHWYLSRTRTDRPEEAPWVFEIRTAVLALLFLVVAALAVVDR